MSPLDSRFIVNSVGRIYGKKCCAGKVNDGIWDTLKQKWHVYPCERRECPRHWRRYGRNLGQKLSKKITYHEYNYHIRLSNKAYLPQGRQFTEVEKLVKSDLFDKNDEYQAFVFLHNNTSGHHFHLVVGTNHELTVEKIRLKWRPRFQKVSKHEYNNHCVYLKNIDHPCNVVFYAILGRKAKPRVIPPWQGINAPKRFWRLWQRT